MDRDSGVSVVIPTFNEAENLPLLLPKVSRALERLRVPAEIVIVDDSSSDGTAPLAERLACDLAVPVRVVRRTGPRCLSRSIVTGARSACHQTVAVMDADLSHDPEHLAFVLLPVIQGHADVVIASRYVSGGAISKWSLWRRLLSRAGTFVARVLCRASDPLSGYFACRRSLLDGTDLSLRPRGYKILFEVLGRSNGLEILEIPTSYGDPGRWEALYQKL